MYLPPHHPCGGVSRYVRITPAVMELSQTTFPHITPVAEYPGTPSYTGSSGIILGLLPPPPPPPPTLPTLLDAPQQA